MPQLLPDLDLDLSDLSPGDWSARLDELGEEHGYFQKIGNDHKALFIDAGRRLLVTFETVDEIAKRPGALPRGFEMVSRNGWSLLAIIGQPGSWFRDPAIYRFFDRQVDDGFFEDFDQCLFFGSHAGGYAAAAYSVAAPGAHVLLLRPVATLDPGVAGWDRRYAAQRRLDFTSRYGYAPEMLDAAQAAWVLFDPAHGPDAMHAALFRRLNVTALRASLAGPRVEQMADLMQITAPLIEAAMDGSLDRASFGRLWRARRDNLSYLRSLLKKVETEGRASLAARVCHHGLATRDRPLYERKLAELDRQVPGKDQDDAEAPAETSAEGPAEGPAESPAERPADLRA